MKVTKPAKEKLQKRDYLIYQQYTQGLSLTDIGKIHLLSRERIRQIVQETENHIETLPKFKDIKEAQQYVHNRSKT